MSTADDMTMAVQVGEGEASGLIFRPGDTLVLRMPEAMDHYTEDTLTEVVTTVREAMGNTVEVVVIGHEMEVHKVIRKESEA